MNKFPFEIFAQAAKKPDLFKESSHKTIWTDPHMAEQMLKTHLDPHTDLASYKSETIKAASEWMYKTFLENKDNPAYLDLGCGPGLYTSKIAEKGVRVSGIDFSENSGIIIFSRFILSP